MRRVIAALVLALAGASLRAGAGEEPQALPLPKGTPHRPVGITALVPHPGGANFTFDDVKDFVREHNLPLNHGDAKDLTVVSFELLTVADFAARIPGDVTGMGVGEMIALSTVEGRLRFAGARNGPLGKATKAYAAFDAVSGNLLYLGTLEQ